MDKLEARAWQIPDVDVGVPASALTMLPISLTTNDVANTPNALNRRVLHLSAKRRSGTFGSSHRDLGKFPMMCRYSLCGSETLIGPSRACHDELRRRYGANCSSRRPMNVAMTGEMQV